MPNPDEHGRVLIYTQGYDFNGEQVFDAKAETLNECFYADPENQPEVCKHATHWAVHPSNTALPPTGQPQGNLLELLADIKRFDRDYLVEADATGNIYPNAEALAFSEAVAAAIKAKLVAGVPKFGLMPYRHNGDYLGFDWIDSEKNSISIVFYTTPNARQLPTNIDPEGVDVGVCSWIDALLLIRMIAERVKGNSVGDV